MRIKSLTEFLNSVPVWFENRSPLISLSSSTLWPWHSQWYLLVLFGTTSCKKIILVATHCLCKSIGDWFYLFYQCDDRNDSIYNSVFIWIMFKMDIHVIKMQKLYLERRFVMNYIKWFKILYYIQVIILRWHLIVKAANMKH